MTIENVKYVILVLSNKGGVGKSTIACQLALSLQQQEFKVGLLDLDMCGPSIPKMLGLIGEHLVPHGNKYLPVKFETSNKPYMNVMSMGFLLVSHNPDAAIVWRGPRKNVYIRQFLSEIEWGVLDYLIIDTPPGTSDEHITIVECLRNYPAKTGAVLVTTPQAIAISDVRREVTFCRKGDIEILGLVENMCGYVCQHCLECTNIFSSGGGEKLAQHANIELLISLPIEPILGECADKGINFLEKYSSSETFNHFDKLTKKICEKLNQSSSSSSQ